MSKKSFPKVCIIGGGIFGLSIALRLDRTHEVTIFEKNSDILRGATYANHNRHHYGFHYPRSLETAKQCLESSVLFEKIYGEACNWDFANYYCVSKEDSLTTPEEYVSFCDEAGLDYEEEWPADGILDKSKIALSLRVKEAVYDYNILKKIVNDRLHASSNININLGHRVISGHIKNNGQKELVVESKGQKTKHEFGIVVNAMYANYNSFCGWFGFDKFSLQFNLQELDIIELPIEDRIGITVQDGPFPSFLPIGNSNRYFLAHVIASQLIREISPGGVPLLNRVSYVESNWEQIQKACSIHIPILKEAKLIRSIFVDRVVDANRLDDDSRITETTSHGHGCWSVFAAKIITCETTSEKIAFQIMQES